MATIKIIHRNSDQEDVVYTDYASVKLINHENLVLIYKENPKTEEYTIPSVYIPFDVVLRIEVTE